MTDPLDASTSCDRVVHGVLCLHVDDLVMTGDTIFSREVLGKIREAFEVGSEDKNNCEFCGQRTKKKDGYFEVDQEKAVGELHEVEVDKDAVDAALVPQVTHTEYRSALGQLCQFVSNLG